MVEFRLESAISVKNFLQLFLKEFFFLLPGVLPFKIFTLLLLQYVVDY